jgi:hypothetical protein
MPVDMECYYLRLDCTSIMLMMKHHQQCDRELLRKEARL